MARSSWLKNLDPESRRSLRGVFRSYDIIGDIVVTRIPPHLENFRGEIGEKLLQQNPRARLVLQAFGPTSRNTRTRKMRPIAGSGSTLTEHHEHKTTYIVDVEEVCFTPRLSFERHRVAEQVRHGERVLNMFAGVGSFSLLIARMVEAIIYSLDNNPSAIECMKLGIESNHLIGRVLPIFGDARRVLKRSGSVNRIIMPLPSLSDEVLDLATDLLIPGGVIHHYREVRGSRDDCLQRSLGLLEELLADIQIHDPVLLCSRVVRSIGRKRWHVVHDLQLP